MMIAPTLPPVRVSHRPRISGRLYYFEVVPRKIAVVVAGGAQLGVLAEEAVVVGGGGLAVVAVVALVAVAVKELTVAVHVHLAQTIGQVAHLLCPNT